MDIVICSDCGATSKRIIATFGSTWPYSGVAIGIHYLIAGSKPDQDTPYCNRNTYHTNDYAILEEVQEVIWSDAQPGPSRWIQRAGEFESCPVLSQIEAFYTLLPK